MKAKNFFFKREVIVLLSIILLSIVGLPKVSAQSLHFNAISITTKNGDTMNIAWNNFSGLYRRSSEVFTAYTKSGDSILNVVSFRSNNIVFTNVVRTDNTNEFNIYPNPSNGEFNISANLKTSNDVTIEVFAMNGQLIKNKKLVNQSAGDFNQRIDGLNEGMYICRLRADATVMTKKIIVKK